MKKINVLQNRFLLIFCILLGLSACGVAGSSGALPQAVIPNELITVSSPDADGNVTVTGAATSVPASSIVIAQVTASTSQNAVHQLNIPDWLIAPAYASTCTSDLPSCPTLDADGKCQDASDETGAFVLTIPASSTSTLSISYLDSTTCAETSTFSSRIPDSSEVISLDLDIVSLSGESNTAENVFMFGTASDHTNTVHTLNLTTFVEGTEAISISGTPLDSTLVTSADDVTRLVLTTGEQAKSIALDSSGALLSTGIPLVNNLSADIPNLIPIGNHNFMSPDALSTPCSYRLSSAIDYTRVYFHDGHKLYYANDLNSGLNNYTVSSSVGTQLYGIDIALYSGATALTLRSIDYAYMIQSSSSVDIFLVVTPVEGSSSYAFVVNDSELTACDGTTTLDTANALELNRLGSGTIIGQYIENLTSADSFFSIFDVDAQLAYIFDVADTVTQSEQVNFLTDTSLGFTAVQLRVLHNPINDHFEYFILGADTAGSSFYTHRETAAFDTGDIAIAIDPKFIELGPNDQSELVIFDAGNPADGLSNAILIGINAL